MPSIHEIQDEYAKLAARWSLEDTALPIGSTPTDDGRPHLQFSDDGFVSLVVTERGQELSRKNSKDIDEILYWIFEPMAYSRAWDYELKHRVGDADSRRVVFPRALDEIGKISKDWREKMRAEQFEILEKNPFYA